MDVDKELRNMFPGHQWEEYFLLRIRKDDALMWAVYLLGILVGYTIGRNR